jgi:hypothetical protein
MNDMECLSLMELLDLRTGAEDPETRQHVDDCPRCRAVLEGMPAELSLPSLQETTAALDPRPALPLPDRVATGQLWRTSATGEHDWSWVVAVIGISADSEDRILVAPVTAEPELATERDLLLDSQALGYEAFLDLQNLGSLLRTQLVECLGKLSRPQAEGLVALYRWTLAGDSEPKGLPTGLRVLDQEDPRLLAAEGRGDELRTLWRDADAQVTDEAAENDLDGEFNQPSETGVGLAEVLRPRVEGPDAEWDRASLLEHTGIDGARFDKFVTDRLDLTDKTDIEDLANVLHVLDIQWEDAERAVAVSLDISRGGRREASGPAMPMAARSQPGTPEEDVTRDLYADQSEIDRSSKARRLEVAAYLAELRRALDDLG